MSYEDLKRDLHETECMAIRAMSHMPKGSKYRHWAHRLLAGELEAVKYAKLRDRLIRFHAQP